MTLDNRATTFHKRIKTQTVLIRHAYRDSDGNEFESHGTGVIVGHGKGPDNNTLKIATAGHVLEDSSVGESKWELSRLDEGANGEPFAVFQTFSRRSNDCGVPYISRCNFLKQFDIGVIAIENKSDRSGCHFIDVEKFDQLKTAPRKGKPVIGCRVAWAGFPGFVRNVTGSFHMCYFEGIISATAQNPDVYFVDGHSSPGVSGGPLWCCDDKGEPIVIGVCIDYSGPGNGLPGLVGFCPIAILLNHIEEVASQRAGRKSC
jgi:hypothetical protein